jgi:FlaA1/EpsC-like NDP-sugar epimerase
MWKISNKKKLFVFATGNILSLKINQILADIAVFALSLFSAFFIRFEGIPDSINLKQLLFFLPIIILARMVSFYFFSVYSFSWRYISIRDAISIAKACVPLTAILLGARFLLPDRLQLFRFPSSIILLEFTLVLLGTLSARLMRRMVYEKTERQRFGDIEVSRKKKNVILIGAGNAGNMVAKELRQRMDLGLDVAGFIDDDPEKRNSVIQGIRVLGTTESIQRIIQSERIDEAIITIANATAKEIRRIVDICKNIHLPVKIVPGLFEMLDDNIKITKIREINIEDLLGRSPIHLSSRKKEVYNFYNDKRILVTGAGGSIGSELCRQLLTFTPKELVLLDKDENSIYEIDYDLRRKRSGLHRPIIADIRDSARLRTIFGKHTPEIVFHAAAHKHVPLMEINIPEAIKNNILGTRNVSLLAEQSGVKSFIFISSDKAVNPTNVMGATKKIGEMIIQDVAQTSSTNFSCVRFGNVLGSRGSVVPLFQKQIAEGGPITITHPDITRYFMSISEAVQLIIEAGSIGEKGEIFVLDMGEPIRIMDLAKDLIKLSGYLEKDYEIREIGLRPGEKLFEEILVDEERAKATKFEKLFITTPIEYERKEFARRLEKLLNDAETGDENLILENLKTMDIGYRQSLPTALASSNYIQ